MHSLFTACTANTINTQYQHIAHEFAKVYYDKMSNGVNTAFELFDKNVFCTIDCDEFKGSYNWLLLMTQAGISKFEYCNISGIAQPLVNYEILVAVQGKFRGISLWGHQISDWVYFNETFVLEKNNDNYSIKNYILKMH